MGWEPLPLEVAEWMGMDDDYLRPEHERARSEERVRQAMPATRDLLAALRRTRRG